MRETVHFRTLEHRHTGLWMILCEEYPGFVVHANTEAELEGKLVQAFESYIKLTKGEDVALTLTKDRTPPGFGPPAYTGITARAA